METNTSNFERTTYWLEIFENLLERHCSPKLLVIGKLKEKVEVL
jgi:hypothetical protein